MTRRRSTTTRSAPRTRYGPTAAAELVDADALDTAAAKRCPGASGSPIRTTSAPRSPKPGVERIELTGRAYRYRLSHADWLAAVGTSAKARYLRHVIGEAAWASFDAQVLGTLRGTVPDPIDCVDEALLAVAIRPLAG